MSVLQQITRFPSKQQNAILRSIEASPRVGDLAFSFPFLLAALSTGYGSPAARGEAIRCIEEGLPLREAARALGLPLCLRRVPPEACHAPLPPVRWSARAARLFGNQVPADGSEAAGWLCAVCAAYQMCDEEFALWVGRQKSLHFADRFDPRLLRPLAMYAWHSRRPASNLQWLAFTPFSPAMSFATALTETQYWFNRLKLYAYFADNPIKDTWLDGGHEEGFEFVPLVSFWDLMEERVDMRNCLDCYADKLASGACRIFGVRTRGTKVATLEICFNADARTLRLSQLKGPSNTNPSLGAWHAAWGWFGRQQDRQVDAATELVSHEYRVTSVYTLLKPYSDAVAEPLSLPEAAPALIDRGLTALAQRTGVTGFPFRLLA